MKQLFFILLISKLFASSVMAQTSAFTLTNAFSGLDADQTKVFSYVSNQPRTGNLNYVNWDAQTFDDASGNISVTLPNQNGGQPINFQVVDTYFATEKEYAIFGKSLLGEIAIYVTPQGKGGTIDLISTSYSLFPLGGNMGLLIERSLTEVEGAICGNNTFPENEVGYCEDDCGKAVLDVLAMLTPEAQTWVNNNFGLFGEWFLFVETHNINGAFVNSAILEKQVRVKIINYTPNFSLSSNIGFDLTNFRNNVIAQQLAQQNGADIRVLITNQDYFSGSGAFGAIPAAELDPTSTNKIAIIDVPFIGSIRYTFAHEVAHHFGCWHSTPTIAGCPNGKSMLNGKNTIMANGTSISPFAENYSRIQHYSNPDISFGGEPTGEVDIRNNAAQIRGAFCEVANNTPDQFSTSFSKISTGPICASETHTFSSYINTGICLDPFTLSYGSCSTGPYQYEWRQSNNPNFANSQIIGNSQNLTFTIQYCPFYLRLTVTSGNGLTTSSTVLYNCSPFYICDRSDTKLIDNKKIGVANVQCVPNPANDQIKVLLEGIGEIKNISAVNVAGVAKQITRISKLSQDEITCNVSELHSGLWFLQVQGSEKNLMLKFIIVR